MRTSARGKKPKPHGERIGILGKVTSVVRRTQTEGACRSHHRWLVFAKRRAYIGKKYACSVDKRAFLWYNKENADLGLIVHPYAMVPVPMMQNFDGCSAYKV